MFLSCPLGDVQSADAGCLTTYASTSLHGLLSAVGVQPSSSVVRAFVAAAAIAALISFVVYACDQVAAFFDRARVLRVRERSSCDGLGSRSGADDDDLSRSASSRADSVEAVSHEDVEDDTEVDTEVDVEDDAESDDVEEGTT